MRDWRAGNGMKRIRRYSCNEKRGKMQRKEEREREKLFVSGLSTRTRKERERWKAG